MYILYTNIWSMHHTCSVKNVSVRTSLTSKHWFISFFQRPRHSVIIHCRLHLGWNLFYFFPILLCFLLPTSPANTCLPIITTTFTVSGLPLKTFILPLETFIFAVYISRYYFKHISRVHIVGTDPFQWVFLRMQICHSVIDLSFLCYRSIKKFFVSFILKINGVRCFISLRLL